jgi:hypothetical protein
VISTPAKLSVFALGLAAVFGLAFGIGHLTGPVRAGTGTAHDDMGHTGHDATMPAGPPAGLQVSEHGYSLIEVPAAGDEFAFRILGPSGRAVTTFDTEHDKRMHLVVVRRDLSGFRHVHPVMDSGGTWRIASPLSGPGTYRAFADFKPAGADPLVLGIDTAVSGDVTPRPLPAPANTFSVDGYTVALGGRLEAGRMGHLTFTISRGGRPVSDLRPYLGAYGHLIALRAGDLAYLHVHPEGAPGDGRTRPGPAISFDADVPSAGTYRLYLDFQHDGAVHTAEFTVAVDEQRH